MGKKNKNKGKKLKKAQQRYFDSTYYGGSSKGSKKKKKNSAYGISGSRKAELKTLRPTLDKKDAKESRKIVLSPVDVPKVFKKNRDRCNHVGGNLLTVEQFKRMTPSYSAYTPAVDQMVAKYGEDHVHICPHCFDVLVDRDLVEVDDVQDALLTLYAACNTVVANRRMKKDEVKEISKLKDVFGDFQEVIDYLDKIHEAAAEAKNQNVGGNGRNINGVPGGAFMA